MAAFIVRLSGCENPAAGPTKNWRISPCGTGPWLRFFEVPLEGRLQPLSCNSEVLGARSESLRALQDSAMPSRASPLTLVHLDPECRPRPHLPRYSGSNLCDSLSDRRLFLPGAFRFALACRGHGRAALILMQPVLCGIAQGGDGVKERRRSRRNGNPGVPKSVPSQDPLWSVLDLPTTKCLMSRHWKGGRVV